MKRAAPHRFDPANGSPSAWPWGHTCDSRPALLLVGFRALPDLECSVHVELSVHALFPWPEVGGGLRHGDDLGPVYFVGVPVGHDGRRALVEDVLQPLGALTIREGGYVRPDRRPTWRTTDVLDPCLPADRKASGRMTRVNKRKAFWADPLMP